MKTIIHKIRALFGKKEFSIVQDKYDTEQELVIYKEVILTNPSNVFKTLFSLDNEVVITSFWIIDETGKYGISDDYMTQDLIINKLTTDNNVMGEFITVTKFNKLLENKPLNIIVKLDKDR